MDESNWINLAILCVSALVGILTWLGARSSAREARAAQEKANTAADRSASAAEEAARLQARIVAIESQRHEEDVTESKQAKLHARTTEKPVFGNVRGSDRYLTIANSGRATASNVGVLINDKPIKDYDEFHSNEELLKSPSIGPNGVIDIRLSLFRNGALRLPFNAVITWDDDSGVPGEWKGTIS